MPGLFPQPVLTPEELGPGYSGPFMKQAPPKQIGTPSEDQNMRGQFMRTGKTIQAVLSVGLLLTAGFHSVGYAQQLPETSRDNFNRGVKNIVLVHGAWADGSSWSGVISLLEAEGYHVVAAQLPLTALQDDDAATER